MPSVSLRGFGVRYPAFTLHPLDLNFTAGERVAVVGANGAGKSTTLKAMAGQMPRYDGRIEIDGREVRETTPGVRASIGFLPETVAALGWMTVAGHLRFLSGFFPTWDEQHAGELLDRMELPRGAKVGTLSKGMKVKLSLVAAEAYRPPLLLLDEPTTAIDPLMRGDLLDVIDECAPAGGDRLVVFSSHLLEDVEKIADRVVFLKNGRLIADRSVAEIEDSDRSRPLHALLYEILQTGQ